MKFSVYLIAIIGFSFAHAGSYDDFFVAIKRDNPSVVRELLARGFDPNTRSPSDAPGLFLALQEPSLKVADVLLDWPQTDVNARNGHDETPLMMAALKGYTALATRLLARGARVNKPGWAPLHYAATNGHLDIMALLLEQHAYIDAESPNGTTPLMMAAQYGTPQAVQMLLNAGADATLKNQLGLTALDFAGLGERKDATRILSALPAPKAPVPVPVAPAVPMAPATLEPVAVPSGRW